MTKTLTMATLFTLKRTARCTLVAFVALAALPPHSRNRPARRPTRRQHDNRAAIHPAVSRGSITCRAP